MELALLGSVLNGEVIGDFNIVRTSSNLWMIQGCAK